VPDGGCGALRVSVDAGRPAYARSHTTTCTPWCRCLQLMMTQPRPGEAGIDDEGEPGAPTTQ